MKADPTARGWPKHIRLTLEYTNTTPESRLPRFLDPECCGEVIRIREPNCTLMVACTFLKHGFGKGIGGTRVERWASWQRAGGSGTP